MKRDACWTRLLGCLLVLGLVISQTAIARDEAKVAKKRAKPSKTEPAKDATPAKEAKKEPDKGATASKDAKESSKKEDKESKDKDSKKDDKPATHRVKKEPFRIEVTLDGIFEAQNTTELSLRPQEWALLSVLKAVEHGSVVKRGDLLVALDTEKIDRTIADLQTDLKLADISVKQAEEQLSALEKIATLDAEANVRYQRASEEDWKQYLDIAKPLNVKMADYMLKMAQEGLEYQQEEYRQLEKMYKADDLTEDTEKIVLRRAKNSVDRAKLNVEFAKASHDESKKFTLPRQEEKLKDATQRALIDSNRIKVTLPLAMSKHRLETQKLKIQRAQSEERLTKLLSDRAAMTVKAPCDGVVYYGRCIRGKWSSSSSDTLRRGATLMPNEVFMTVVQLHPISIRAMVPESQVQNVRPGVQALAVPNGFSETKLTAIVQRVAAVPTGSSGFDAQFTLAAEGQTDALVPGMNCDLKMIPYKKADDLTIPPKAVFTEEFDPAKQYVYLVGKGDKPEKRPVTLGKRNDKQVEVLKGLAEGDNILLEKPKADKE